MATSTPSDSDEKKRSMRASEFLKTGSELVGKSGYTEAFPENPPPEPANQTSNMTPPLPVKTETKKPRTGIVSSTIHSPAKPPAEAEIPKHPDAPTPTTSNATASKTAPLKAEQASKQTRQPLPAAEKSLKREIQVERMADKIVDLAEGFVLFKTGMLNPQLTPSQKVKLVAQRYPHLFKRFGKVFGGLIPILYPLMLFLQKLNQKMAERQLIQPAPVPQPTQPKPEEAEATVPPEPEKVSFLELAEKNIIFCDNHKRPLYSLDKLRDKYGRTASEDVIAPYVYAEVLKAFQEVAVKAKGLPTPESGLFAGIPMETVMENTSERDILLFLNYVKRFPRGYTGKNFRITESYAGWVLSGTPDD